MATVNIAGVWKIVTGTAAEIVQELANDGIQDPIKIGGVAHDGTNLVIIYKFK